MKFSHLQLTRLVHWVRVLLPPMPGSWTSTVGSKIFFLGLLKLSNQFEIGDSDLEIYGIRDRIMWFPGLEEFSLLYDFILVVIRVILHICATTPPPFLHLSNFLHRIHMESRDRAWLCPSSICSFPPSDFAGSCDASFIHITVSSCSVFTLWL